MGKNCAGGAAENSTGRQLTRRQFGRSLGAVLATACLAPEFAKPLPVMAKSAPPSSRDILLDANENPYGPCAAAIEAISHSESVACRYPFALRDHAIQAIANSHHVRPDNIAIGCGSTEILRACDAAFVGPNKKLVVAEPTFEAVSYYAQTDHARAVKIPLTADFRQDLPKMAAACTGETGMVYVCNPNNPTGAINTSDDFNDFLRRVPPSVYVLVDEAYYHFVENPHYASVLDLIASHPNLVMARTFSKVYGMAGMRLGFGVGQREAIRAVRRELTEDNGNCAVLSAGMASLADREVVPVNKKRLNETRKWVVGQLTKDGHRVIPSEANFFMVDVGSSVVPVIEAFRKRRILVGREFPAMSRWLRVSVGKPEEMRAFLAAFREIVPGRNANAA